MNRGSTLLLSLIVIDVVFSSNIFAISGDLVDANCYKSTKIQQSEPHVLPQFVLTGQLDIEKFLYDPSIALKTITHHQSTFTNYDICKFINEHTTDVTQFQIILEKTKASDQIVTIGKDKNNIDRFTTKEMLFLEKKMLEDVRVLENKGHELVSDIENVVLGSKTEETQNTLKSGLILNTNINNQRPIVLSFQQKNALDYIQVLEI